MAAGGFAMDRPSTGELWNGTIAVTHRHFGTFAVIAAVTVLLPSLLARLMFPQVLALASKMPSIGTPAPQLPAAYWLYLLFVYVLYAIGLFSIAAVSSDPDEGGGNTMGAIIGSAFPAIGKSIAAAIVLFLANIVFTIVVGIAVAVIIGIAMMVFGSNLSLSNPGPKLAYVGVVAIVVLVTVAVYIWVGARMAPLAGVYLRESGGVIEGIKRAWALSRGLAWPIIKIELIVGAMTLVLIVPSFLLARAGWVGDLPGFVAAIVLNTIGALFFAYQAAGLGFVYRRLVAAEAG